MSTTDIQAKVYGLDGLAKDIFVDLRQRGLCAAAASIAAVRLEIVDRARTAATVEELREVLVDWMLRSPIS